MKVSYTKRLLLTLVMLFGASLSLFAQNGVNVSGKVTLAGGEPGPGVTVVVKGTTTGMATNVDGTYTIPVPDGNATLVFSYIGYTTQETLVGNKTTIDVNLKPDAKALEEVLVIGYGEQSRATLTTSISKVGAEEFKNAPAANPLLQLQGKVAGLSLQVNTGQPGSNPQIFIRGGTSTAPEGDSPLFIVDGIVGQMRNISDINPDNIESIQVLKDAASTAIYGARAANGVIIIKTKSGIAGKPRVNFKSTFGFDRQGNRYDFTSARDYIYVSRNNINQFNKTNPDFFLTGGRYGMSTGNPRNSRNTLEFLDTYIQNYGQEYTAGLLENDGWETMVDPVTGRKLIFQETDYQDVTFQKAFRQEYDFDISGGSEKANYFIGLGHLNQQGLVLGSYYKNYSALLNATYNLSDNFSVNTNISYQLRQSSAPGNYQNVLSRSVTMPFTYRLNYEDGRPAPGEGVGSFRNRNHEVYYREKYDDNRVYRSTISLGANWDILPGLTFAPKAYWFTTEGIENSFEAANEVNANRNAAAAHNFDKQLQLDGALTYQKDLGNKHHTNTVIGTSYINTHVYRMNGSGRGAATDYITTLNATALETQRITTTKSNVATLRYFGRTTYDYDRKYLFSASIAIDGSSNFAANHKFGTFPGVSAGWNVHNEPFWQPFSPYLSTFKLRTSYGKAGNDAVNYLDTQGSYSPGSNYFGEVGILNTRLANRNLVWETTTSFDAGVDIGLFNDKVNLLIDYYNKLTSDRIFGRPLDGTTGFSSITSNFGSIRSRGVEVELSTTPVRSGSFTWNLNFNFAFNRSIAVELPENSEDKNRSGGNFVYDPESQSTVKVGGIAEGERYGGRWAFNMIGVYATDADAADAPYDVETAGRVKVGGDAIWQDVDGNGRIDNQDMVFMGYIRPDKTGGMVNSFTYKGFSARFVVDYAIGHVIDNSFRGRSLASARNNNMTLKDVVGDDIWKEQGDIASIPRYTVQSDADYNYRNHLRAGNGLGTTSAYSTNNSLYYSKGDFLAFREVSLNYRIQADFLKKAHIQGLDIFGGIYNIGYLTGYDGLMPEVYEGADQGSYPRPRQFNFGVNASF